MLRAGYYDLGMCGARRGNQLAASSPRENEVMGAKIGGGPLRILPRIGPLNKQTAARGASADTARKPRHMAALGAA